MRCLLGLLLTVFVAVTAGCADQRASTGERPWQPEGALTVFFDDFDDDELGAVWNTCHWWSTDGGCTIASNNELEWYQPANVIERDGVLRLEARIEDVIATDGTEFGFTSGMVTTGPPATRTEANFAFQYGAAEARVRVPAGAEFWPAFWLLPASTQSRPEIDIMEMHGDEPRINDVHLHSFDASGERASFNDSFTGADYTAGWHNFAVVWTPDSITWLVDGEAQRSVSASNDDGVLLPHEPLYLVLNLAIDSDAAPPLAGPAAFPAALEVDWIQVWQLPADAGAS